MTGNIGIENVDSYKGKTTICEDMRMSMSISKGTQTKLASCLMTTKLGRKKIVVKKEEKKGNQDTLLLTNMEYS